MVGIISIGVSMVSWKNFWNWMLRDGRIEIMIVPIMNASGGNSGSHKGIMSTKEGGTLGNVPTTTFLWSSCGRWV